MPKSTLKEITIDQLEVGFFVAKVDISWLDSPFLGKTRLIKKQFEIDKLKSAGAKKIVIDVSKGGDVHKKQEKDIISAGEGKSCEQTALTHDAIEKKESVSVQKELGPALLIRKKINQTIERLQLAIKNESPLDTSELESLVDDTLQSLTRNDQALMSLVHISRKTQKLADHAFGTFCLSLNLAILRGVSSEDREKLGLAALFHEAGWASLPLNLMGKRTPYTKNDKGLVEKHTLISEKLLKNFDLPELSLRIIAEHHERLDGSGYPHKLMAADIHPLTQLFSVVDTYDERVHQLLDKPGMLPTNALKLLYRDAESGKFNPEIVAAYIHMLGIYPPTTAILLNTGEKAVIKEVRVDHPLQPIIAIYYDKSGHAHVKPEIVDLLKECVNKPRRSISAALDLHQADSDPANCLKISDSEL